MQECPCVACLHLKILGTWAAFSLDICHHFPHRVLAIVPLRGGMQIFS